MTTLSPNIVTPAAPSGAARILAVVRLHLVNPWTIIYWPWIIMGIIFIVNYGVWWILRASMDPAEFATGEATQFNGGSFYIFVYMMVVAIMAMNLTFPFALGYGVTRRDFYLGSSLTFVLLSAMYAIGLTILSVIERATDGYGVGGQMFTTVYYGGSDAPLQTLWIFFVLFLFFFFTGALCATVYVRWKAPGLTMLFCVLALALVGLLALAGFTDSWGRIADFFGYWGFLGSYTWSLVITVLAAVGGYLILRRATPRG